MGITYTLLCIKLITNKDLLHSIGNPLFFLGGAINEVTTTLGKRHMLLVIYSTTPLVNKLPMVNLSHQT